MDIPAPGLHLRPDLLAAGVTDGELQRLRRSHSVTRVRRGAYVPADDERLREPESRHALLVQAAVPRLGAGSVVSHVSAAVMHGLPVWNVPMGRVHVTRHGAGGGRITRGLRLHIAPLDRSEVSEIDGTMLTSVARTVLDLARSVPFAQAVVVADGAQFTKAVDREALRIAQERSARWRGGPQALRVVEFSDRRAESPGESRSRVAMWRAGLPRPVLQWEVWSADGRSLGRVDFGWPGYGRTSTGSPLSSVACDVGLRCRDAHAHPPRNRARYTASVHGNCERGARTTRRVRLVRAGTGRPRRLASALRRALRARCRRRR